jgi:hypothetical protein
MSQYPAAQVIAVPNTNSSDERITWALVALIVVLLAAGAGWAIASSTETTWGDLDSTARLAEREGAVEGRQGGFARGAKLGRKEARMNGKMQVLQNRQQAFSKGWADGFRQGRERALARRNSDSMFTFGMAGYPDAGYEDVSLSADSLLGDVSTPSMASTSLDSTYGTSGLADYYGGSSLY